MFMYSDPEMANDPHALEDVEVFFHMGDDSQEGLVYKKGWYWWYCLNGFMPTTDPEGPYETEDEAINAARKDAEE